MRISTLDQPLAEHNFQTMECTPFLLEKGVFRASGPFHPLTTVTLDPMIGNNPVLAAPLRGAALTIFGGAVDSGAESVIRLCMADEEAGDTSTHPCRRKGDGEDDRVQRWKACFQACLLRGSRTDENSFRVRV
eukprot:c18084_g1_i1 orf=365-763(+)